MPPNLLPVILGAILTLAGTLIVQILAVPPIQARTRQRERWEDDVIELRAILEESLPNAIERFRHNLYVELNSKALLDIDNLNSQQLQLARQMQDKDREAAREAEETLRQLITRVELRLNRIDHHRPTAPYWNPLRSLERRLRLNYFDVTALRYEAALDISNYDDWSARWKPLNDTGQQLHREIEKLSRSMKPPDPQRLKRVEQKAAATFNKYVTKVTRRKELKKREDSETEPQTDPPQAGS